MTISNKAIDSFRGPYHALSNFYPVPLEWDKVTYPTLEHAYQASKLDPTHKDYRNLVAYIGQLSKTPGEAKIRCRTISNLAKDKGLVDPLKKDWESLRMPTMHGLLMAKFVPDGVLNPNCNLQKVLVNTYPKRLIEGNTWNDTFWGMIKGANGEWIGHNYLGRLLMHVRGLLILFQAEVNDTRIISRQSQPLTMSST